MDARNRYVALIDDDAGACVGLARLLRACDMHVATFSSAEDFVAAGPPWPYDCLVLDLRLGGMSGLDLQRKLLQWQVAIPVFVVSADDDPKSREEARSLGALAFFHKTEPGDLLIDAIEQLRPAARPVRGGARA
jgi:FixJ family two-component response regulator